MKPKFTDASFLPWVKIDRKIGGTDAQVPEAKGRTTASANKQRGREFRAVATQISQARHGLHLSDQRQPVGRQK